ncbi:MAG: L,D-transpeptidase [Candidatus Eisenbacteria bacterium]|nr:L,D-transpeptidase [Candidatus Eisenbacteria bacterium]
MKLLWVAGLVLLGAVLLGGCQDKGGDQAAARALGLDEGMLSKKIAELKKENGKLESRLEKLVPKDDFIVVNTTLNRIYLRRGDDVLLDAPCSTGSNTELIDSLGRRRWFFSTPRGVYRVRNRMEDPVWVQPDWAFVEAGEPIPAAHAAERFMPGVLGDYGLYFGNGYLIHGTIFERFIGQSVTHGCIRVGGSDLQTIWDNTKVGTPIYIF